MIGGLKCGTIQYTELRLRLSAVDTVVQAVLLTSDGVQVAAGKADACVADLQNRANRAMLDHRFDRGALLAIGEDLGKTAFPGKVGKHVIAKAAKGPLRLRVEPEGRLSEIPWEISVLAGLMPDNDEFAVLCPHISFTRHVVGAQPFIKRAGETQRVLVAWANPASHKYPHLHYPKKEAESVIRALRGAESGSVQVRELPFATVAGLIRCLADYRPDILHFIGHGDVTPAGGAIVLEGGMPSTEALLYAEDLAAAVVGAGTTLAVLSGCLTSGTPTAIGTKLAAAGVPAVLAMSIPILDIAAHQFARAMYSTLAAGRQLDEAVFEGRCALAGIGSDFAAPQLMLSGPEPIVLAAKEQPIARQAPREPKTNLTYDNRPFIGRSKERAELRNAIRDQGRRLVTITGPGGIGKTRLSKQVAAELLEGFPDGAWFVDCGGLIEEQDLVAGIAASLPFGAAIESKQALIDSLARKRTLIVLDCFENAVSQGPLIEEMLGHDDGLFIIVTSRLALGLPQECQFHVLAMSVLSKSGKVSDGISLFAEAAGHAKEGFSVTARNRKLVTELCSRLEGVPLAIVLAAGRLRQMSLTELVELVREQSNVESAVAVSLNLLPVEERRILRLLGIFVGSFTIVDAANVTQLPEAVQLSRLLDLRDHSLVHVLHGEIPTRYKVLDSVRDFLLDFPIEPEFEAEIRECKRRHAERFAELAIEIDRFVAEGRWAAGVNAMMRDLGNLRLAVSTAKALDRYDLIASMVSGLAKRFFEAGLLTDFRSLADAGYESASQTGDASIRIQLLGLDGALAAREGSEQKCESIWLERVELCRKANDIEHYAEALIDLAWRAIKNGRPEMARLHMIEALRLSRKVKDYGIVATVRVVQARIAFATANLRIARLRNTQSEHMIPKFEDCGCSLFVFQNLAISSRELGDSDRCLAFTAKLLRLSIERNDVTHAGWALLELAPMYDQKKQLDLAARCYTSAMKVHAEYSTRYRTRAIAAYNQFKRKSESPEIALALANYQNKPWQEIVKGIG